MQRGAGILIFLAFSATLARAQPLRWQAPAQCPAQARLRAEVERLLGQPLPSEGLVVRALVEEAGRELKLELSLEIDGAAEERTVESRDCDALMRAAALMIATRIDPDAVERALESEPEPSPPSEVASEPEPAPAFPSEASPAESGEASPAESGEPAAQLDASPSDEPDEAPPPEAQPEEPTPPPQPSRDDVAPPTRRWSLGVFGTFDVGAMPAVTLGPGGRVRYGGRFDLALDVAGFFNQRSTVADGAGGDIAAVAIALTFTWNALARPWIRFGPAVGLDGMLYFGEGFGVTDIQTSTAPMLRAHLGAHTELRLIGRLLLSVDATVHAALLQPQFELDDIGVVFTPSLLAFRAQLGLCIAL